MANAPKQTLTRKDLQGLKVAIVHDWLVGGGAERVVYQLHKMFPDAPIYTSYCTDEWRAKMDGKVVTGWLQYLGKIRKFIPFLRIVWFTRLNLDGYDLVISSSGAEAKGIKTHSSTVHVNYCHAPTHYYWSRYDEYLKRPGFGILDPVARLGLKMLVGPLRSWDLRASKRPDFMVANSTHIAAEIKKYYRRNAEVIFPPIDISRFEVRAKSERRGFVIVGRQTPYKRIDLAVQACTKLDLPLTVIGNGPDHMRLVRMAGPSVTFIGNATDETVVKHMQMAEGFIFPGLDDFGITPIEAMAAGTPVVAYKAGGALDYITPQTGLFFERHTAEALGEALQKFPRKTYDHKKIRTFAEGFSPQVFESRMTTFLEHVLQQ